jgi:hypothetical protein
MALPFTPERFFGVFAAYNEVFWPVAVGLWLVTAWTVIRAWRHPAGHSRALSYVLGGLWLWNALAYHTLFFARINPAAWLFAAVFALQGVLLLRSGRRHEPEYFSAPRWRNAVSASLVGYAFAYPFLNLTLGHAYPGTPTFGIPCPTAILTIGLLLSSRSGVRPALAITPALWGFVGGSAAVLLAVWPDYVLLAAGVLLVGVLLGGTKV